MSDLPPEKPGPEEPDRPDESAGSSAAGSSSAEPAASATRRALELPADIAAVESYVEPQEPAAAPAARPAGPAVATPAAPPVAPPPVTPPPPWAPPPTTGAWPTTPPPTRIKFDRARWLPTISVAVVIAAVVLGGMGIDAVWAAPSAGVVDVGGSVTITAAPGWVLDTTDATTGATAVATLRKADAVLTAQVVVEGYSGTSASIMDSAQRDLRDATGQVSFGDRHETTIGGNETTYVSFQATVTSSGRSGVVDGEVVCMVVGDNAVVIEVAAPQGRLDAAIDDVSKMLKSVRVGR